MAVHSGNAARKRTAATPAAANASSRLASLPSELRERLAVLIASKDPDGHLKPEAAKRLRDFLSDLYASHPDLRAVPGVVMAPDGGFVAQWHHGDNEVVVFEPGLEEYVRRAFAYYPPASSRRIDLSDLAREIQALYQ